jgi:class 3 adenylate cyclase
MRERRSHFGQTVNVASHALGLADPTAIFAARPIVESANVAGEIR